MENPIGFNTTLTVNFQTIFKEVVLCITNKNWLGNSLGQRVEFPQ